MSREGGYFGRGIADAASDGVMGRDAATLRVHDRMMYDWPLTAGCAMHSCETFIR
jgi:hypothetical protein